MSDKEIQVSLKLPFFSITGKWRINDPEMAAAWELYVELATRVATVPLADTEGLLREVLSSSHTLFESTRDILRRHGRNVAPRRKGYISFGVIATTVLNTGIRPFLSKWHPALEDHECGRAEGVSRLEHEQDWGRMKEARAELATLREALLQYAKIIEAALSIDGQVGLLWDDETSHVS